MDYSCEADCIISISSSACFDSVLKVLKSHFANSSPLRLFCFVLYKDALTESDSVLKVAQTTFNIMWQWLPVAQGL